MEALWDLQTGRVRTDYDRDLVKIHDLDRAWKQGGSSIVQSRASDGEWACYARTDSPRRHPVRYLL